MRIALYSGSIPSTSFIERLIGGIVGEGSEVVVCGRMTLPEGYKKEGVITDGFSGRITLYFLVAKFLILFLLFRFSDLMKLISAFRSSTSKKKFSKWFAEAGPIVWRRPDVFHIQWAKSANDWMFLEEFGIPIVLSLRGAHVNYSPLADEELAETYRRVFPRINGFHAVSNAIREECRKYRLNQDQCKVVYSGLRLSDFPFDPSKQLNSPLRIISVGRPHWIKGYDIALDAMNKLKVSGFQFEYEIVGGVNEEHLFQIHDLELERFVTFTGKLDIEEVKRKVADADVLLVPSVLEGLPNVMLEAMALGTIVVVSNTGGVSEVIENRVNGFVVGNRSPEDIEAAVTNLRNLDHDSLVTIREKARETIEKNHTEKKMVEGMMELYRNI